MIERFFLLQLRQGQLVLFHVRGNSRDGKDVRRFHMATKKWDDWTPDTKPDSWGWWKDAFEEVSDARAARIVMGMEDAQ